MLTQTPEIHDHVDDYSIGSLLRDDAQETAIIEELSLRGKASRSFIVQYAKLTPYGITAKVAGDWKLFLKHLAHVENQKLQGQFASLISNLAHLDMLPLWLNLCFQKLLKRRDQKKAVRNLSPFL